ncbi:MAG: GatB/YqeY domain-containing protein [Chloroflexi bacterium]|nr:GatB/YqeY domain-containing protein [Chloroflexota bacterium]
MTLKGRLQQDLLQAIKDHAEQRKSAIRLVRAAILNEEIARQHELSDEEVLEVIRREVRQHRESLAEFEKAQRADLVAEEKAQLEVLLSYLPRQMSRQEIVLAAQQAIAEVQATKPEHLGQVMRILMPRLRGKADGSEVNQIVKELLAQKSQSEANSS